MVLGPLEVSRANDVFTFTFAGPHGPRSLGVARDLRGFTEARLENGMRPSADLAAALERLRELGNAHDWDFLAMSAAASATR